MMKRRVFLLVLAILMMVSCLPLSSVSAESMYVRKVVSVVYDDSGSMSADGSMNWSYANYAMQTLCGLLNAEDELYITYMSSPDTSVMPADFSSNRQTAVDNIRTTLHNGNTPQSAVTTAQNKLVEIYNANSSNSSNIEYWLVVLSDGEFNEAGVFGKAELDTTLQSFSKTQIAGGMNLHTIYLAIGSNAIEATSESSLSILAKKCDDGKAIVSVLSELSNEISGRYGINSAGITLVNDNTVEVTSGIPLENIAILMQNSSATLTGIVSDDGTVLTAAQQVSLKYPEKTGWTSDSNLNGKAFLVENADKNIPAGKYTLTFSDKVDINALDMMVEPALEIKLSVLKDGRAVTDINSLHESDIIDVQMKLYESGTDNEVDVALLEGAVKYSVGYKENDAVISSSDSMTLKGITLKALKTDIYGTMTFGDFLPMTVSLEGTPSVFTSQSDSSQSVTVSPPSQSSQPSLPSQPVTQAAEGVYGLTAEVPDNYVIDRDGLSGNIAVIRFVLTKDGVPLTKEESRALPFEVTLDRNIPYTLTLEDDGSYSFRPESRWPPLFYPTGIFTVTGILNHSVSQAGVFEITASNMFSDVIMLLLPLLIIIFAVFYLTKKRFQKGFITRRRYFFTDNTAREGSKVQVFVSPLTGWWQLYNYACTKKYAYLTFIAARGGEVTIKSHIDKPIEYRISNLTDDLNVIQGIFTGEGWQVSKDLKKRIYISETSALYIRNANNIAVYYFRKWKKRSSKRPKSSTGTSSPADTNSMYMYEPGDRSKTYESAAELAKAAAGIVTGTVLSSKPAFRFNKLYTMSKIQVDTVYRGPFTAGEVIEVGEHGGEVTLDEYIKGTELDEETLQEISGIAVNTPVVVGVDGYYPMPRGQHVLLFLEDTGWKVDGSDQTLYACLGGYDGIFYQQNNKTTYVKPLPDASGVHMSLENLCVDGGKLSVTLDDISKLE